MPIFLPCLLYITNNYLSSATITKARKSDSFCRLIAMCSIGTSTQLGGSSGTWARAIVTSNEVSIDLYIYCLSIVAIETRAYTPNQHTTSPRWSLWANSNETSYLGRSQTILRWTRSVYALSTSLAIRSIILLIWWAEYRPEISAAVLGLTQVSDSVRCMKGLWNGSCSYSTSTKSIKSTKWTTHIDWLCHLPKGVDCVL